MSTKRKLIIEPDELDEKEEAIPDDVIVNHRYDLQRKPKDPYHYPISQKQAFLIANHNENLKTDFCRNKRGNITYLFFEKARVRPVELLGQMFWHVQILSGEISGMKVTDQYDYHWDGVFSKRDLKLLQCYIDVNTGEYFYLEEIPKKRDWKFWRKWRRKK